MKRAMKLSDTDNVATLLDDISCGETAVILDADKKELGKITVLSDIRRGHKAAVTDIPSIMTTAAPGCPFAAFKIYRTGSCTLMP